MVIEQQYPDIVKLNKSQNRWSPKFGRQYPLIYDGGLGPILATFLGIAEGDFVFYDLHHDGAVRRFSSPINNPVDWIGDGDEGPKFPYVNTIMTNRRVVGFEESYVLKRLPKT